jgi:hypothetical protein
MGPLWRVRATGDRQQPLAADSLGEGRQGVRRDVASRCRLAADDPHRNVAGGRIRQVRQPAIPAVLQQHAPHGRFVEAGEPLCLGGDVPVGPARVGQADRADRVGHVVVAPLRRVLEHRRDRARGESRRIEQDEDGGHEAGGRQRGGGQRAPAVPDDREILARQARGAGEGGDVRRVVPEAVVAEPAPGVAVSGLVDRHDPPTGGGQRRSDPPPDRRRRGDAVDQQERRIGRRTPRARGPADPGRVHAQPRWHLRAVEGASNGRRQVRRRRGDRRRKLRLGHDVTIAQACRAARLRVRIGRPARYPESAMANQFVVQLKNEPGSMATLAEELAAHGVDLRAIGGGGIGDSGHVIMTTADDEATKRILEAGGYTFIEGESILAEVDDRPGGMARLSRQLADAGVNIYGHLFLGRWGDRAMFAFVVDDPDRARPILERKS